MFFAAFVGWLIGKVLVGLVRGIIRLVEGVAYLIGAASGLALAAEEKVQRCVVKVSPPP